MFVSCGHYGQRLWPKLPVWRFCLVGARALELRGASFPRILSASPERPRDCLGGLPDGGPCRRAAAIARRTWPAGAGGKRRAAARRAERKAEAANPARSV